MFSLKDLHDQTIETRMCITSLYYSEVYFRVKYGILLWGARVAAREALETQKSIIIAIDGVYYTHSSRPLFRDMNMAPQICIYILELYL